MILVLFSRQISVYARYISDESYVYKVSGGVPQSSVFEPMLFILFMLSMGNIMK